MEGRLKRALFLAALAFGTLGLSKRWLPFFSDSVGHAWAWCPEAGSWDEGYKTEDGREGYAVEFKTGAQEGCGVGTQTDRKDKLQDGSVNVGDIKAVWVKVKLTAGKKFMVKLNESGVRHGAHGQFHGLNGADGEQWASPAQVATGQWQKALFPLSGFQVRKDPNDWSNLRGNGRLDKQALWGIDVYVPGGQGQGRLNVQEIGFE